MLMSALSPICRNLLLGCLLGWGCGITIAAAQDSADEQIETLETIEVPATVIIQEERHISIPEPDTTAFVPLTGLADAVQVPRTRTVSQRSLAIVRDSIADRKGRWKPVRPIIRKERQVSIPEPDTTTLRPSRMRIAATISKTHPLSQGAPEIVRDSIADRKGVRKPVRPIKADRPPYPQVARKRGWEGTVLLRLTVNREGTVERVNTHKSSGFPDLDESAVQAVKTWRFSPAKDGEFPISATVDLPVRFDLDEYND